MALGTRAMYKFVELPSRYPNNEYAFRRDSKISTLRTNYKYFIPWCDPKLDKPQKMVVPRKYQRQAGRQEGRKQLNRIESNRITIQWNLCAVERSVDGLMDSFIDSFICSRFRRTRVYASMYRSIHPSRSCWPPAPATARDWPCRLRGCGRETCCGPATASPGRGGCFAETRLPPQCFSWDGGPWRQ